MMAIQVMNDLMQFEVWNGPLVLPVGDIVQAEARGLVVDLETGKAFLPVDAWEDFAQRWVAEIMRRCEVPTEERLSRAILRANGAAWSQTFCNAVAYKVLSPALNKSCTAPAVA